MHETLFLIYTVKFYFWANGSDLSKSNLWSQRITSDEFGARASDAGSQFERSLFCYLCLLKGQTIDDLFYFFLVSSKPSTLSAWCLLLSCSALWNGWQRYANRYILHINKRAPEKLAASRRVDFTSLSLRIASDWVRSNTYSLLFKFETSALEVYCTVQYSTVWNYRICKSAMCSVTYPYARVWDVRASQK